MEEETTPICDNGTDTNLHASNHSTNCSMELDCIDYGAVELDKTKVSVLSVISILTLVGNGLTFMAILARQGKVGHRKSPVVFCIQVLCTHSSADISRMYFFLLHLSLADILTAFFSLLPEIIWTITLPEFYGDNTVCKTTKFLQMLGPYLSSYLLCVTAFDRFKAICRPLENCHWAPKRSKMYVAIAWTVAIICSTPQLVLFRLYERKYCDSVNVYEHCMVTFEESFISQSGYILYYSFANFFIPLIILLTLYSFICRAIWRNARCKMSLVGGMKADKRSLSEGNLVQHPRVNTDRQQLVVSFNRSNQTFVRTNTTSKFNSQRIISRAKIRSVKLTLVVIIFYIFCSAPFIIGQIMMTFGSSDIQSFLETKMEVLLWMVSLNSVTNPWIYLAFNQNLLSAFKTRFGGNIQQNININF